MLTFQLVTKITRFYVVGFYIAPTDKVTCHHVHAELADCPKGVRPLLLGDFNSNLLHPIDKWADDIADVIYKNEFTDLARHFDHCE